MKYKVVIPTAGLGSRLQNLSRHVNKALVTIDHKPSISYIIEKIARDVEIVIPLGHKKETVMDYLCMAYPERKFTFIEVAPFSGDGSGLGLTLLHCKDALQLPFIFCSNDTIVEEQIPVPARNWMGYADTNDTEQYRSIRFEGAANVTEICSKGASGNVRPYIGLAGIHDYEEFWHAMERGRDSGSIEVGESYGLRFLIEKGISPIKFSWWDTGNLETLKKTRAHFRQENAPTILEKEEEAIWFVDDKVIKFAVDKQFIANRVSRVPHLGNFVPELLGHTECMYAYRHVTGETFSRNPTLPNFKYLLDWLDQFWRKRVLKQEEADAFKKACRTFYEAKTYQRIQDYFSRFEQIDTVEVVNGSHVPRISELLDAVDWDYISDGCAVRFHGDLHFENILIKHDGNPPFVLLDWRQDFGGLLDIGDIYYDMAKLLHGLIISHQIIERGHYVVSRKLNAIEYDFHRRQSLIECEQYLKQYVRTKGYDLNKLETITALIFLNIASLHAYPYSLLLFYLGKNMLYNSIQIGATGPTEGPVGARSN